MFFELRPLLFAELFHLAATILQYQSSQHDKWQKLISHFHLLDQQVKLHVLLTVLKLWIDLQEIAKVLVLS